MAREIGTKAMIRPAAVAIALASGLQPATAAVTLHCNPVANVDPIAATALCDAFTEVLATSNWAKASGVTLQLDVSTLRPTAIRVALTLTDADGRNHVITRGLSAADTTITPTMKAAFLKKLRAAIPTDF